MEIIGQIVTQSTVLQQLLQRSKHLQLINYKAQSLLPPTLNQHCYVANLKEKVVVMHVHSSIWATQLRFFVPDFISLWQQDSFLQHLPISKVETKVRPLSPKQTHLVSSVKMSTQTAALLRETAHHLEHPKLKAALLKLANRDT